jgi:hypothetical protein
LLLNRLGKFTNEFASIKKDKIAHCYIIRNISSVFFS